MSIRIACMKGCGDSIEVTDEQLAEFARYSTAVEASHDVCPRDVEKHPTYRVTVSVARIDSDGGEEILLAKAGGQTEAPSFVLGLESIGKQLQESWEKVHEMAPLAESDLPTS